MPFSAATTSSPWASCNTPATTACAVPEDFGIIGFDDISYASLPLINLSTVSQPRNKLGEQALQALLQEIDVFPARTRQRILVEPELKVRATT